MKSICKYCSKEFSFFPSQSGGIYCSNSCQGKDRMKQSFESNKCSTKTARQYLKEFTEYKCSVCGIFEWNKKELTLQMDHIDGNNKNNKIENLRWLCPNCHTQTSNWGSLNISDEGRKRLVTNMVR